MYSLSVYVCSGTSVTAEVEEVELEDGTKIQPISVVFPEGNNIPAHDQVHPYTVRSSWPKMDVIVITFPSAEFCVMWSQCFKTVLK